MVGAQIEHPYLSCFWSVATKSMGWPEWKYHFCSDLSVSRSAPKHFIWLHIACKNKKLSEIWTPNNINWWVERGLDLRIMFCRASKNADLKRISLLSLWPWNRVENFTQIKAFKKCLRVTVYGYWIHFWTVSSGSSPCWDENTPLNQMPGDGTWPPRGAPTPVANPVLAVFGCFKIQGYRTNRNLANLAATIFHPEWQPQSKNESEFYLKY